MSDCKALLCGGCHFQLSKAAGLKRKNRCDDPGGGAGDKERREKHHYRIRREPVRVSPSEGHQASVKVEHCLLFARKGEAAYQP